MKLKENKQLTANFKINEFLSDNDKQDPNAIQGINLYELAQKLQVLRGKVGPITVNSGFRGVEFNKSKPVGGSPNSHHLQGLAADIKFNFKGHTRISMTKLLQEIGFTNVNFYWTTDRKTWVWIHADIGKTWNGQKFNYRDLDSISQKEIKI